MNQDYEYLITLTIVKDVLHNIDIIDLLVNNNIWRYFFHHITPCLYLPKIGCACTVHMCTCLNNRRGK